MNQEAEANREESSSLDSQQTVASVYGWGNLFDSSTPTTSSDSFQNTLDEAAGR